MDNHDHQTDEEKERRNSNTEYLPTKCRITKPAPPKPATNPLQFIKLSPCPLFVKAQQQIKKVEEIKKEEKDIGTEVEDWQTNLDNWKSSRRKRQEHIIERVVEVKKLTEQEESDKNRRRSKTFSEMMEERSKGRHKFNIPLYENDSNDLSDYGIGSSSSKTSHDDDTLSHNKNNSLDLSSNKENCNKTNQSGDEIINTKNGTKISDNINNNNNNNNNNNGPAAKTFASTYTNPPLSRPAADNLNKLDAKDVKQYTYEGAIEDYRSRIQTINSEEFRKGAEPADVVLPKGEIFKRKDLFEKQTMEIGQLGSASSKRLSEIGAVKSIKDRLKIFEQNNEQIAKFNDAQLGDKPKKTDGYAAGEAANRHEYLADSSSAGGFKKTGDERCFSPETELYVNKLNMFNRDLDNLMINKSVDENYTPSVSSTELTCISSDREDSGIHTGDISCSVSQADESVDIDIEINSNNDKLNDNTQFENDFHQFQDTFKQLQSNKKDTKNISEIDAKEIMNITEEFLEKNRVPSPVSIDRKEDTNVPSALPPPSKPKPIIYENVDIKTFSPSVEFITNDFVPFTDFNAPLIEPPKVKPPPPPPPQAPEDDKPTKLAHLRSSFLGLEDPEKRFKPPADKPPDLTAFLHKIDKKYYNNSGALNKVESQDSGLDVDRGRLSSDTWCSSVGDSSAASHEKLPGEATGFVAFEEDEIAKKEREIIELVEKEEQYRDVDFAIDEPGDAKTEAFFGPTLGNEQFDKPCFDTPSDFLDQDSEVLKVEQELRQLELEELERQRENLLFRENRAKVHHNRHSLENITERMYHHPSYMYENHIEYRKSLPELVRQKSSTMDYPRSVPVCNYYGYENVQDLKFKVHSQTLDGNLGIPFDCRKSMPDLPHNQKKFSPEHHRPALEPSPVRTEHRKSMPELLLNLQQPPHLRQTKPPAAKERILYEPPGVKSPSKQLRGKPAHPKLNNNEGKNYNQHWLIQEAELRRLSDQRNNYSNIRQQPKQNSPVRIPMDKLQQPISRSHRPPVNYALPSMSYTTPVVPKESHDKILSVSGKKKCSYCGNELGRGAAMIVESLCLFYHMDCFKCCVCHVQLGDGMMGTDVKVRNQKLHCNNCYSSDDGIKFSCV
ncbi:unnamed protein product [Phyllotreta striolata]|uniref:LIM zinc-binding domain-containing protein n=1 Tax=Phyllotreta striolata TaxID=444603 RepID=A0A9N9XIP5_PHYSR|nr:unnamed protein product [Phyllotreta striolata]